MALLLQTLVRNRTAGLTCRVLCAANYSASVTGSKEHIADLVSKKKLVVFMKGTPQAPQCGFSNGVMQILKFHGVDDFDAYNVLEDQQLRTGIKEYSDWPTIPQVYMNGEFVGGCDILLDMHKSGELIEELKKIGVRSALLDELQKSNTES